MPIYELSGMRVRYPAADRHWVAPSATLIGNVTLEDDASVWFGSIIRGDNEPIRIGRKTNIQDNCVLHTDPGFPLTIGDECTIGHLAMLHGCTVGSGSLVGIGAVILNGARIGEQCLIGSKALIPENKVIPPRSLVLGAPGKIIRPITDADLALIAEGVQFYFDRYRQYARELKPQT